jgi:large subunit ribosomal protein L18
MRAILKNQARRQRRQWRVRAKLRRTSDALRLSVHRSSKHISAQVIDDAAGRTLCAVTSTSKALADQLKGKTKTERAALIGEEIAKRAMAAGVTTVVFDRGDSRFHGRVKALAEAARTAGLKF